MPSRWCFLDPPRVATGAMSGTPEPQRSFESEGVGGVLVTKLRLGGVYDVERGFIGHSKVRLEVFCTYLQGRFTADASYVVFASGCS